LAKYRPARRLLDALDMLRQRALGWLDEMGALEGLVRLRAELPAGWLPILNYHRLHPDAEGQAFDRGVIDATPQEFERQMRLLTRHFTPIGVGRLADHVTAGVPLPDNPALVTFDDGYRECFTQALPILRALGVPASFFIPTRYIGERRVFWWDRLSYLVRWSPCDRIALSYPTSLELRLEGDRQKAIVRLLGLMKSTYDLDVDRFLSELAASANVRWDATLERRFADELCMSWDEIRALKRAGMEIHSHTRSHRILQNLRPPELRSEIAGSRDDLIRELGGPVRAIAYPVGRSVARHPEIARLVRASGYELGFTLGVRRFGPAPHPLDIGRIAPDRGMAPCLFRALLVHPALAV
jgi:peptidoglycan/xylan/chitin deacetylase (PgdA/CDA1 family)